MALLPQIYIIIIIIVGVWRKFRWAWRTRRIFHQLHTWNCTPTQRVTSRLGCELLTPEGRRSSGLMSKTLVGPAGGGMKWERGCLTCVKCWAWLIWTLYTGKNFSIRLVYLCVWTHNWGSCSTSCLSLTQDSNKVKTASVKRQEKWLCFILVLWSFVFL